MSVLLEIDEVGCIGFADLWLDRGCSYWNGNGWDDRSAYLVLRIFNERGGDYSELDKD